MGIQVCPAQSFWPGLGGTETWKVQEGVLWGPSDRRGSPEACTLLTLPHAGGEPLAASECSLAMGPMPSAQDSSEWVPLAPGPRLPGAARLWLCRQPRGPQGTEGASELPGRASAPGHLLLPPSWTQAETGAGRSPQHRGRLACLDLGPRMSQELSA